MRFKIPCYLCATIIDGDIAQLVEQWTENPCVGGSNPSITTKENQVRSTWFFFLNQTEARFKLETRKKSTNSEHSEFWFSFLSGATKWDHS